ncbi:NAD(P)H-dependent oxidoreductase [Microbacterium betulae]|uniref:NAD(P)H-dependent oxidoreductase n=1 Tax=Microbacterium betulae TaxID=2981139 RepID=A0AA97I6I2_9MICO|nr:NAD(P)H-dependent oxidoreductase [Microbacterium sp. AB]WOF22470.1 NAD(P)H-dependent oxidoreductase [Microbacterium sp. AB]
MSLRVAVVVGNPRPLSRTRRVAELLVEKLLSPGSYELEVIDLADHVDEIFAWPSDELAGLNASVAESDLVVFASPTYKATYTGLLKAFLDRYPANGLAGVTAIPVHTGADFTHALGPTFTLSPLLAELGAAVPGRGFYLALSQLEQLDEVVEAAAAEYAANLAGLAKVSAAASAARV